MKVNLYFSVLSILNIVVRAGAKTYDGISESGSNDTGHSLKDSNPKVTLPYDGGCVLYLAESSLPGAGLGVYAGVDFREGESIGQDELPILISSIYAHNAPYDDLMKPIRNYEWSSPMIQSHFHAYGSYPHVPGLGMITNGHSSLSNMDIENKRGDDIHMDRKNNPGAGAITEWHTVSWKATEKLEKGTEFLFDYGDDFFESRIDDIGSFLAAKDYGEADEIVHEFLNSYESLAHEIKQELWNLTRNLVSPLPQSVLPEDIMSLDDVRKVGTAKLALPNYIRSVDWLKQNGLCMDNIVIKESSIPHAGRGAFATRFISKGSLVVPAPLMHIHNKIIFNMYKLTEWEADSDQVRVDDTIIGQQLLLNYCFGHLNSTLLLHPYTNAAFINHNSKPNAEVVWSSSDAHRSDWLDISVENLSTTGTALMFDVIATKEIYSGDEVFIDYGEEWEQAWKKHVGSWTPVSGADDYVHPDKMNLNTTFVLKTNLEQLTDPYPSNLRMACYYEYGEDYDYDEYYESGFSSKYAMNIMDDSEATSRHDMEWNLELLEETNLWPCEILNRYENDTEYSVRIFNSELMKEDRVIPDGEQHIAHRLPREAIRFADREYESNYHLKNAFRHPIGIPRDIFPAAWINF